MRRDEEHLYFEEGDGLDIRRYLQILLNHKWLILACLVTGLVLAQLETSMTTPLYRASTTIQIDPPSNVLPYKEIQAVNEMLRAWLTGREVPEAMELAS